MYEDDDSIDFKPEDKPKIHDDIDLALLKIRDKIKIMDDIKTIPPKKNEMNQRIEPGVYEIDLDSLLNAQISDCPATVIPMLIDHGVRTAVDIKDTYKPEKRLPNFNYFWIIFLIIGLVGLFFALMMFGVI